MGNGRDEKQQRGKKRKITHERGDEREKRGKEKWTSAKTIN